MTAAQSLALVFECVALADLRDHVALLRTSDQTMGYVLNGQDLFAPAVLALTIAESVLQQRDLENRHYSTIVKELRAAARKIPTEMPNGAVNLLSWLGAKTMGWYTVYSYSSPDPRHPWFCSLDRDAQCLVLLLVAELLETST